MTSNENRARIGDIAAVAAELTRQVAARANARRARNSGRATRATKRESHVRRAREMFGFAFDSHRVDVRGWNVYSRDAQLVGAVESLFVDTHTKAVRYLGIAACDSGSAAPRGTVVVPVGLALRPVDRRVVVLDSLSAAQIASAPRLANRALTRADEYAALAALGVATSSDVDMPNLYTGARFAERALFV